MPDGHDEWEYVSRESTYNKVMKNYYDSHPTYNSECDDAIDFEKRVKKAIYGNDEYRFNGGF